MKDNRKKSGTCLTIKISAYPYDLQTFDFMDFGLYGLSPLLAELLERLSEFHRSGYVVEGLLGAAGSDDGY